MNLNTNGVQLGTTAAEIVSIARSNIGTNWLGNGCTAFVWSVTNLAGLPFFDLANRTEGNDPRTAQDTLYAVPHTQQSDISGDGWGRISDAKSVEDLKNLMQPGDVVRVYKSNNTSESTYIGNSIAAHSFIVVDNDGNGNVNVVDNWYQSTNECRITQHSFTDIATTLAPTGAFEAAFVSRINAAWVEQNVSQSNIQGNGLGDYLGILPSNDDYASGTATNGRITVGNHVSGQINTAGDHDWFQINLTANTLYDIRQNADSGSLLDSYLRLRDSSGRELTYDDDDGQNLNSWIAFTPSVTGTYYLDAGGFSNSLGAYSLSVASRESTVSVTPAVADDYASGIATNGRITVGSHVSGQINTAGDHDWFQINLTANTLYDIRQNADSGSLLDSYLRLRDSSGRELTYDDDDGQNLNSWIAFTPSVTGTYYLDAGGFSNSLGAYSLSVASRESTVSVTPAVADDYASGIATNGRITVGSHVSGQINTAGDHDWFQINLTADRQYQIRQNADSDSSSRLDSYLRLMDTNGQELAHNDDDGGNLNSLIVFTPSVTGIYYVDAGAFGNSLGAYSLWIL